MRRLAFFDQARFDGAAFARLPLVCPGSLGKSGCYESSSPVSRINSKSFDVRCCALGAVVSLFRGHPERMRGTSRFNVRLVVCEVVRFAQDDTEEEVFTQERSTSATLHACAIQPPPMCGARASNTSPIVPNPSSLKCTGKTSRNLRAPFLSSR
jgi:hypothetical protein